MGVPPGAYLRRIRLDAAALRLKWTQEDIGRIAAGLGYSSQASFTHAFIRRFGMTPSRYRAELRDTITESDALENCGPVDVRWVDSFRLFAKRYIGDIANTRDNWHDFETCLPGGYKDWRRGLFINLLYDDPRTTRPEEMRCDCCVTVDEATPSITEAGHADLQEIRTPPGLYASLRFKGSRDRLLGAYQILCDHWIRNSRYAVADGPGIEIHGIPRNHMNPDRLEITILIPLE